MASSLELKKDYRCDLSLQQFYTGGPFAVGSAPGGEGDAEAFLACACGGEVRVVSASDAFAIGDPIEGENEAVTALTLSPDSRLLFSAGHSRAGTFIELGSNLFSCLGIEPTILKGKTDGYFLTVGERGVLRIWCLESALCIFEQQSSDVTIGIENEESRRGFTSAVMLPNSQGLLCVTADQQFLFYRPTRTDGGAFQLNLYKCLVGYNDEILHLKFVGEDEQYLAVATNLEQVRVYDVISISCSYVLSGHTEIVVCIDTCVSASGKTLVVTGSKDNTVRLWDMEKRSCIGFGKGHLGAIGSVAFSKKSKNFFVSGSSDWTIKIWSWDDTLNDVDGEVPLKAKAVVAAHDKDINSLAVVLRLDCSDRTACIWKLPNLIVLRASFLSRGTQFVSCGKKKHGTFSSDGLVKLWTIKTNECISTYDKHDGKVWTLALGRKTEMLATGGTDAVLNLCMTAPWKISRKIFVKRQEEDLRGQELENAVLDSDYTRAIQLAFELRRPHRLLDLFSQLCRMSDMEDPIEKALLGLPKEDLDIDESTSRDDTNGSSVENGEIAQVEPAVLVAENFEKSCRKRKSGKSIKKGHSKKKMLLVYQHQQEYGVLIQQN
ncbi:hypothetical protein ABZP36_007322 [Zizania latifolia]